MRGPRYRKASTNRSILFLLNTSNCVSHSLLETMTGALASCSVIGPLNFLSQEQESVTFLFLIFPSHRASEAICYCAGTFTRRTALIRKPIHSANYPAFGFLNSNLFFPRLESSRAQKSSGHQKRIERGSSQAIKSLRLLHRVHGEEKTDTPLSGF